MYTGRTQRDKDRLAEAITEDAANILKVEKKDIIVVFQESPHGNWYINNDCRILWSFGFKRRSIFLIL
jgi:4-oxalocrotonate tautomerase